MSLVDELAKFMFIMIDNNILTELNYSSSDFIDILAHQFVIDHKEADYEEVEASKILTQLCNEHYKVSH